VERGRRGRPVKASFSSPELTANFTDFALDPLFGAMLFGAPVGGIDEVVKEVENEVEKEEEAGAIVVA
jgi:hypothetical protein